MQAILFAALLANARAHVDEDPFFAPVAGALLALLLFLRFDAVWPLAQSSPRWRSAPSRATASAGRSGRRSATGCALCSWYLVGPMREYFDLPSCLHLAPAVVAVRRARRGGEPGCWSLLVAGRRSPASRKRVVDIFPPALAVLVVALAALRASVQASRRQAHGLRCLRAADVRVFYFTIPAFIAALVGYVLVVRGLFWRDPAFLVTLTAFSRVLLLQDPHRPRAFLGGAAVPADHPARGAAARRRRRRSPACAAGCCSRARSAARSASCSWRCSRVQYARAARPVVEPHRVPRGSSRGSRQLAGRIGDDDLLIVESRDAGSDVHVLALPLAYIYARNVLVLSNAAPDKAMFARVPRQRARAIPARAVPRRRRHRPAVVALERDAARQRALSGPRVRVGAERVSALA